MLPRRVGNRSAEVPIVADGGIQVSAWDGRTGIQVRGTGSTQMNFTPENV